MDHGSFAVDMVRIAIIIILSIATQGDHVPHVPRNNGNALQRYFDEVVVPYDSDECLIWPFAKYDNYGSARLASGIKGIHRAICTVKHGPPPTPQHQAAHSCHVKGCVNGRHIHWLTPAENMQENGPRKKRTSIMENKLRAWLDEQPRSLTQAKLAEALEVHPSYISDLISPRNTTMPSLKVAVMLSRVTKGEVKPEDIFDHAQFNRDYKADMV
jgi:predicted XRE-type DNA-binding protein